MARKGSITVFLTLILSLMLALVCTSIESVRMAAARTQILNSVDIGLYSLFGQFDRKLLEEYELFALDGSFGGGELNMAKVYDNFESYMKPILDQNSQKLTVQQGGLTGYRLMTDEEGAAFYQQIVRYMQETLGGRGVQLLIDNMQKREKKVQEAENAGKNVESGGSLSSYETEMNSAAQKSHEAAEAAVSGAEGGFSDGSGSSAALPARPVENPITVIKRIMKMGILELVLPSGREVSAGKISKNTLVSGRSLQKGMAVPDGLREDTSYGAQLLFQQYLLDKFGNYTKPSETGLGYQAEYILTGKDNDLDNLRSVAKKLLLVREGVNFACLTADSGKRAQAEALAAAIASGFLIPPAASVITAALLLCWAFAESVLDVRELFDGGKVPLTKNGSDWQISLENLPNLLGGLDSMRKSSDTGMSYEDYLQVFLMAAGRKNKVWRAMDMMELSVRTKGDRPDFRLDSCITAAEVSADVKANSRKEFCVTRLYCYD